MVEVASGAGMMVVVVASCAEMLVAEMLEETGWERWRKFFFKCRARWGWWH